MFERFASLHDVHSAVQKVEITVVDGEPEITVQSAIDTNVTNAGWKHWLPAVRMFADGDTIGVEVTSQQSSYVVDMASCISSTKAVRFHASVNGSPSSVSETFKLRQNETITFHKYTTIYTSRDVDSPLTSAQEHLAMVSSTGYDDLLKAHRGEWEKYWQNSDVEVDGDDESQLSIRFALYHILIAAPRQDDDVSIGAKTLSGFGYKGHIFWDTELFIVPPLTLTQPDIARNLLMYRYHELAGRA